MTRPSLRAHHKLFLSYTLLVAGVVAVLIIGVEAALRQPLLERARVDLVRELTLGRELYDASPDRDPDSMARRISGLVGHRVTIIAQDGTVLGESDVPPAMVPRLENHAARSEVMAALTTGSSSPT